MEGNDLAAWTDYTEAVVFEGVLAAPPDRTLQKFKFKVSQSTGDWDRALRLWRPGDHALKTLISNVNRIGIRTYVYTFLDEGAAEAIERWLARKGVGVSCTYYSSVEALRDDLRYNREVYKVYVPTYDMVREIGPRATAVSPDSTWSN